MQAAIEMVAKVKETLSKSAALKAGKDNEENEDALVRAKVEKLKKVPHLCILLISYMCTETHLLVPGQYA